MSDTVKVQIIKAVTPPCFDPLKTFAAGQQCELPRDIAERYIKARIAVDASDPDTLHAGLVDATRHSMELRAKVDMLKAGADG